MTMSEQKRRTKWYFNNKAIGAVYLQGCKETVPLVDSMCKSPCNCCACGGLKCARNFVCDLATYERWGGERDFSKHLVAKTKYGKNIHHMSSTHCTLDGIGELRRRNYSNFKGKNAHRKTRWCENLQGTFWVGIKTSINGDPYNGNFLICC
ncbi:hypothetical protein POVCU1_003170 [Plasmodium ovale curtisi]|uniref:Uncharacterized protein n=1 Tax=Plasmodium ovale curtisi TaxID=864141 RepID=A0A1A8VKL2_PLAOA|nr:hypothetical protein POVCU1_003170 [Plasmodium ovale curtisi]